MIRIDKPWGFELIWAQTDHYVGKLLYLKAGHRLSKQYHVKKEETILVNSGELIIEVNEETFILGPGEKIHIPPGTIHRMSSVVDTQLIEVSTTELDDVVRIEDDYSRV